MGIDVASIKNTPPGDSLRVTADKLNSLIEQCQTLLANLTAANPAIGPNSANIDVAVKGLSASGVSAAGNVLAGALGASSSDDTKGSDILPESNTTSDTQAYSGQGGAIGQTAISIFSRKGVEQVEYGHDAIAAIAANPALSATNPVAGMNDIESVKLFDASVLLDLSQVPPASGGVVPNLGYMQGRDWITSGAWSRVAQGNGYVWKNETGPAGITFAPLHSEATPGASFYAAGTSISINAGTTTFGITDPNNDLKALFEWTSSKYRPRLFKMDISSGSPTDCWGTFYIGEIVKSGNDYTITGYKNQLGVSRACIGSGTWSTTNVRWRIYEAVFETESFTSDATYGSHSFAISLWYAPGGNYTYREIFGKHKRGQGAFFAGFGISHGAVASTRAEFSCHSDAVGYYDGMIPNTPILRHYALLAGAQGPYVVPMIDGRALQTISWSNAASPFYGMLGIGMDVQSHEPIMPQDSLIAFPRIWRGGCSEATIAACYEYERSVLGLPRT